MLLFYFCQGCCGSSLDCLSTIWGWTQTVQKIGDSQCSPAWICTTTARAPHFSHHRRLRTLLLAFWFLFRFIVACLVCVPIRCLGYWKVFICFCSCPVDFWPSLPFFLLSMARNMPRNLWKAVRYSTSLNRRCHGFASVRRIPITWTSPDTLSRLDTLFLLLLGPLFYRRFWCTLLFGYSRCAIPVVSSCQSGRSLCAAVS